MEYPRVLYGANWPADERDWRVVNDDDELDEAKSRGFTEKPPGGAYGEPAEPKKTRKPKEAE